MITTIGQAFELRFKEFLRKSGSNKPPPLPQLQHSNLRPDDPEYYNDLPGKEPPASTQSGGPPTSNLIGQSGALSLVQIPPDTVL